MGSKEYKSKGSEYRDARIIENDINQLMLSSGSVKPESSAYQLIIGQLEAIPLPNFDSNLDGVELGGVFVNDSDLQIKLKTSSLAFGKAIRVLIPRGELPQDWWIAWDRNLTESQEPQGQTDGLISLMTALGKLLVDPTTTPAASFCLLTSS